VWITQDGGKKWLPMRGRQVAPVGPDGTYKQVLELPGEGLFGLCLVVKSKVGLGKAAPRMAICPKC